ncbi:DUF6117 family protein, partial [bacterium]|nr:DUF6117 family protein [bacterium]
MATVVQQQTVNFETIKQAFENGDVALLECQLKETGERVAVITAVYHDDGEICFVPFAMLFNGNPYELLNPP